jgi:hypothetical protein
MNCGGTCQQCCSNSDCPGYQECFNGTCGYCSGSNPCPTGFTCVNGGCFKSCSGGVCRSTTCTANCTCTFTSTFSARYCLDAGAFVGPCSSNANCPQGTLCSSFASGGSPPRLCTRPCHCPA